MLGHRGKSDAFWAALTNATAGVALEVDEGSRLGGGHPAIHVVPGALAVAEERRARRPPAAREHRWPATRSARGSAARPRRAERPLHGTWGTISTAVAVAKLDGAPAQRSARSLNLAASMSPANTWTPALEGATIRNLYPGRSAFQGILAVELERCGFTGLGDAPSDVYGTILADRFEPEQAVAGLEGLARADSGRASYRIEQNYFKLHACCRFNHFALDAVMALRSAHRLAAGDVEKVEIVTIPFAVRMGAPDPPSLARRPVLHPLGRRGGAGARAHRSVRLRRARRSPTSASRARAAGRDRHGPRDVTAARGCPDGARAPRAARRQDARAHDLGGAR